MAVPRHSHTRSKVGKTRMHKFIKPVHLNVCPKCNKPILSHTVCSNCGFYKGVEVINVLGKMTSKEKKIKEKEMKQVEKEQKKENHLASKESSK
jgi:large subunit ribosomal protein L32